NFRALRSKMSASQKTRARREASRLIEKIPLQALRAARRLSQAELATTLRTRQSSISRLERRTDMHVSTLRTYVEAMGGRLEITARFPDGSAQTIELQGSR